jgi:uncharacterized membrane-anchored protein YhcB (DUF1043 family)
MNWQMVAALVAAFASVVGIATTVICVSFWSGKLTQQIADNREMLDEHGATLTSHGERLSDHDVELAKLNEWKNGYNAATALVQKRERLDG